MEKQLLRQCEIGSQMFDFGSDFHFKLNTPNKTILDGLLRYKRSEILVLAGDLFDTSCGENCIKNVNNIIRSLSKVYKHIIYTPGNHCLRGSSNPWDEFEIDKNVIFPRNPTKPIIATIGKVKILAANLFYDMQLIDPAILGLTKEEIIQFYKNETNDGKHLFGGSTELFGNMTKGIRDSIDESIDLIVTHSLPHPSLARFLTKTRTREMSELEQDIQVPFLCYNEWTSFVHAGDNKYLEKSNKPTRSLEEYINWWNKNSYKMGSDALKGVNFKNGLSIIYGHNHLSDTRQALIERKFVRFYSHQQPQD